MSNEAYIVRRLTSPVQPTGVTQITDLKPNTSRRSLTYDKVPQSGYLSARLDNDNVTASVAANVTTTALSGLAAYFADVLASGATANGITPANADAMATAVIAVIDAGTALGLTEINAALAGVVASTTLVAGTSIGTVADVLKIAAGGKYTVPSGTAVQGGVAFKGSAAGMFYDDTYRQIYQTGSLTLSVNEGDLASLKAASKAVVYDAAGALL